MDESDLRQHLINIACDMSAAGLSPGRSGNVSVRHEEGMLITPSGLEYEGLKRRDIVFVGLDRTKREGERKASSETPLHLAIYDARPETQAIVHCHSPAATALSCARRPIPAYHYMVAVAGGKQIPLSPYATFGTQELADNVAATLDDVDACLMANHGQIAIGSALERALFVAKEVENLARQYIDVMKVGEPVILDDQEMDTVLKKFSSYGQNAQ
ncbi:MAG: class II aldolase/adducin family protein [Hyphomicrobiales bacterium]